MYKRQTFIRSLGDANISSMMGAHTHTLPPTNSSANGEISSNTWGGREEEEEGVVTEVSPVSANFLPTGEVREMGVGLMETGKSAQSFGDKSSRAEKTVAGDDAEARKAGTRPAFEGLCVCVLVGLFVCVVFVFACFVYVCVFL